MKTNEDKKKKVAADSCKTGVDDPDYKSSAGTDEYVFYGYPQGNYLKQVSQGIQPFLIICV